MSKADAMADAGKTAVLQNIHGTMEFLQKFPPFNQMDTAHLAFLVEHCQLRFYAEGDSIIKPSDGVLIARVQPDTPAQKAGLQDGDVVVKVDGKPTPSTAAFMRIIASRRPDAEVNLEIIREGERMTKQATLVERTDERLMAGVPAMPQRGGELARLGLTVEEADADLLKSMNLERGAVIASVKEDSPAAERGLQAGDVITKVNGREVQDADSMRDAVSAVPDGRPLRLTVVRDGEQRFVILRR